MDTTLIALVILSAHLMAIFGLMYIAIQMRGKKDELLLKIIKVLNFVSVVILLPVSGVLGYLAITSDFVFPADSVIYGHEPIFFWFGIITPVLIIFCVAASFSLRIKHGTEAAALSVATLLGPLFSFCTLVFFVVVGGGHVGFVQADYVREEYVQIEYAQEDYPQEEYAHADYPHEEHAQEEYAQEEYAQEEYAPTEDNQNDDTGIPIIDAAELEIGNIVVLAGNYWRILDIQDGKVLLLSEYILLAMPFHEEAESSRWEISSIREYLNTVALYNIFSFELRAHVAETTVANYGCLRYPDRVDDTVDRLFLLSVDEVLRFLGDIDGQPDAAGWIEDQYNAERVALLGRRFVSAGEPGGWFLRSCGRSCGYVMGVADGGGIFTQGVTATGLSGIRPAMWVYLELSTG